MTTPHAESVGPADRRPGPDLTPEELDTARGRLLTWGDPAQRAFFVLGATKEAIRSFLASEFSPEVHRASLRSVLAMAAVVEETPNPRDVLAAQITLAHELADIRRGDGTNGAAHWERRVTELAAELDAFDLPPSL
jgi:hypothetical protein